MLAFCFITIFTSAALLFLVQPMFARMVLPLLGGAPAVWNTAMVFYQATLLLGYAYAHFVASRLGVRRHALLHLLILLLPLCILPFAVPSGWTPPTQGNPSLWLLMLMAYAVGLPFFAVSTTSPVIQKWFAGSGHRHSADPYFLYAASNLGSMLALLSYPVLVEPYFSLELQSRGWMWGYWGFVVFASGCVVWVWKLSPLDLHSADAAAITPPAEPAAKKPGAGRRFRWILLSFVPTSLMLSVTNYLSSEVAVIPLLWIIPLALYLLTFILVFSGRAIFPRRAWSRALPIVLVPLTMVFNLQFTQPIGWLMLLHLAAFFIAAMLCHSELAADRPETEHLTEFYLWMSVGGVLGGIFNALIAPIIFNSLAEYPLMLVLACLVGNRVRLSSGRMADWLWPVLLGLVTVGAMLAVQSSRFRADAIAAEALFGIAGLVCFLLSSRPLRFALGLGALFLAGSFFQGEKGRILYAERSFFGVHRVALDPTGRYHLLIHGATLHGMQSLDPGRRHESLAYYHRTGPIGEVLALYGQEPTKRIGAVGLGAGSLASFAQPGQSWTYFEIDPIVLKLARDPRWFSFLSDSLANLRVVLGDARVSLVAEADGEFDILVVDAFSSDAIPAHLVTREALALYLKKLAPGGMIAFHISNLHLDLEPVFAALARDARLVALTRDDTNVESSEAAQGKSPSIWLVMARSSSDLARLDQRSRWRLSREGDRQRVWTDDYSSLLSVFRWQ